MSDLVFLDSNILLYLESPDTAKAMQAFMLLQAGGVISVQVLNEFASVAVRKFAIPIPEIRLTLRSVRQVCTVQSLDIETHELGLNITERYRFDIYDSLIVASALRAGCTTLYTEDLQHGQVIDGLTIRNPFIS